MAMTREQEDLSILRPWELEDRIRQLEAEVRRLTDEIHAIEMGYPRPQSLQDSLLPLRRNLSSGK